MKSRTCRSVIDLTCDDGPTVLRAYVQCRLSGQLPDFDVRITGQGLVLRGCARTYLARQQAEDTVRAATTLPILANEIEVS